MLLLNTINQLTESLPFYNTIGKGLGIFCVFLGIYQIIRYRLTITAITLKRLIAFFFLIVAVLFIVFVLITYSKLASSIEIFLIAQK